jgi:uncharacterized protein YhdP
MRHYRLTNQERAGSGFTDQFVIDGKELTAAAVTQTINLVTLTNTFVDDIVLVRLDEKIAGPAGTVKIEVGDDGDPNYHVALTSDLVAGTVGYLWGPATTAAGSANRYGTTIGSSTVMQAKLTSSSGNFSATTNSGQLSIFMRIVQSDDLGYDQS